MSKGWITGGSVLMIGGLGWLGITAGTPNASAMGLEAPRRDGASISGNLLEILPDKPRGISDAVVSLTGEELALTTSTASDGSYAFPDLGDGDYSVEVTSYPTELVRPLGVTEVSVSIDGDSVNHDFHFYSTVVRVTVVPEMDVLHVSPNPLYIVPGQDLTWILSSPDEEPGPFTVHFNPMSPLEHRRYMAGAGDGRLGALVRTEILPGKYSYFVAVEYRGRILTEDPELIDENGDEPTEGDR